MFEALKRGHHISLRFPARGRILQAQGRAHFPSSVCITRVFYARFPQVIRQSRPRSYCARRRQPFITLVAVQVSLLVEGLVVTCALLRDDV